MKKLVRTGVWETNSSSAHSLSIADSSKEFVMDIIYPDQNGVITLKGGQYGRNYFKSNDALEKANYAAQAIGISDNLIEVIKDVTGADEVVFGDLSDGYIDHQSVGLIKRDKEWLKNFIFNKNSWLFGGSDEDEPDPTFYHVPEYRDGRIILPVYKYELKIDGIDKTTKYLEYPTEDDLRQGFEALLDGIPLYKKSGLFISKPTDMMANIQFQLTSNKDDYFEYTTWCFSKPYDLDKQELYLIQRRNLENEARSLSIDGLNWNEIDAKKRELCVNGSPYSRTIKYHLIKLDDSI